MMETQEIMPMLELEERLRSDFSGAYKREVMDKLEAELGSVKRKLSEGLETDEFETLTKLQGAIEIVIEIVDKSYRIFHDV